MIYWKEKPEDSSVAILKRYLRRKRGKERRELDGEKRKRGR